MIKFIGFVLGVAGAWLVFMNLPPAFSAGWWLGLLGVFLSEVSAVISWSKS